VLQDSQGTNSASTARRRTRAPRSGRNQAYEERIRDFYNAVSRRPALTTRTQYMNMGYWQESPQSLDDACEAMARFMGEFGNFRPEDRILDAGCGFGDQDIYWAVHNGPEQIVGVNISAIQVTAAQQRIRELGLQDRITIHLGSATDLPFADQSFDKVVALESAQHFGTREDFFRESYRILTPGGRIYTTDIIPMPGATLSRLAMQMMALNEDNLYPRDLYARKLAEAGFGDVEVTSIRDVVLVPYKRYMEHASEDAPLIERLRTKIRKVLVPTHKMDYVLATAVKQLNCN
jgi:cyclopropane fatty-acyl-phospholipid synthase-like methyltransferase